ncbi:hypothetical protein [Halorarius halobius]|uniref:DUF7857 domain-containing protein n=1 Tax=Halorarius halobius TaxID=2962671 RepID=UPI0020CEE459|nr:hypothetical protein [Halorarius halobius]
MVSADARCRRIDGRTLVECRLRNESESPERVRVESRLDGPVHPPREGGVPAAGWSDGVWTGQLEAGARVGVGFATSAAPADPPVRVEAHPADDSDGQFGADPTAETVARELSDPRPPRAALFDETGDARATVGERTANASAPANDWLESAADRVERLEALAAVRSLPDATAAVAATDGLAGSRRLCERTREDRERLLELARRAERLAGRIEAAELPVETLERLS